jgi:hypothetical protein
MNNSTSFPMIAVSIHTPPTHRQSICNVGDLLATINFKQIEFTYDRHTKTRKKPKTGRLIGNQNFIQTVANLIRSIPATRLTPLHVKPSDNREQLSMIATSCNRRLLDFWLENKSLFSYHSCLWNELYVRASEYELTYR